MKTGGKYDARAFKKAVGLNGVGTKAVNALSSDFRVESFRDDKYKFALFEDGNLLFSIQEERLSRIKNHWGAPNLSINYVLNKFE